MSSQKKSSLKQCIKCTVLLTDDNWNEYDKKTKHYICKQCHKIQDKNNKTNNLNYNQKQAARYHNRKSAVIHFYGDNCAKCGEDEYYKLTIHCLNNIDKKIITTNIYDYLYNNIIDKDNYQVLCYNCSKNKNYKDKYALRDKIKVINHYGGECFICKEDKIEKLIIDKSNITQPIIISGVRIYRWIIKNNYPSIGLQVLCHNCNKLNFSRT